MPDRVYQLKVTIMGIRPPVWRRLLVPEAATLAHLHDTLQEAFGWWDSHLHEFEIAGRRYGNDFGDGWSTPPQDERRARLRSVAGPGTILSYVYDFGDNWEHKVVVEKVLPAEAEMDYPRCTGGRRACPPEDCGGVWGYQEFLAAIGDPEHEEHDSMLDWVGGEFDPEEFDPRDVNRRLHVPSRAT